MITLQRFSSISCEVFLQRYLNHQSLADAIWALGECRTTNNTSIAEKCFDIWGILKMASVKSVGTGNNCFSVNHIIRCRSKFLPLGFSKCVLVLIL